MSLADRVIVVSGGHHGGTRERHSVTVIGSGVSSIGGWGTRTEAEATRRALLAALEAPGLTIEDERDDAAVGDELCASLISTMEVVVAAWQELDRPRMLNALALLRQVQALAAPGVATPSRLGGGGKRPGAGVVGGGGGQFDVAESGAE